MNSTNSGLRPTHIHIRGVSAARFVLAGLVLILQSIQVSNSYNMLIHSPLWVLDIALPSAVLALSGFLLARSADSLPTKEYLLRRLLRIIPPLAVAVLLMALVLGPMLSLSSLGEYARDPAFAQFFFNIVGIPQYWLPGLFEFNNLSQTVHGGFWMLPYFLATPLLIKLLVPYRNGTARLSVAAGILTASAIVFHYAVPFPQDAPAIARAILQGPGLSLLLSALYAAIIYKLGRRIILKGWVFAASLAIIGGIAFLGNGDWVNSSPSLIILAPAISCATLFVTLHLPRLPRLLEKYNLSYGIFLYSFPIQQMWMQVGDRDQSWVVNALLTIPIVLILAALSWLAIERRQTITVVEDEERPSAVSVHHARRPGWYAQKVRAAVPVLMISLFIVLIILGVMLMTLFAFQPESGGA